MDFIPIEPDENLESILDSAGSFPFTLVEINHPGDYDNENVVLRANEEIDSLCDYIFTYSIEDTVTGIPTTTNAASSPSMIYPCGKAISSRYTPVAAKTPQP